MNLGPVELIVIEFPGGRLDGKVAPALKDIVDDGTIRIIDLLFVRKDGQGKTTFVELEDSGIASSFKDVDGDIFNLISADDVDILAKDLANNSAAALIVWENTWATRFAEAVRASNGRTVTHIRIPHAAVEAAMQASQETAKP